MAGLVLKKGRRGALTAVQISIDATLDYLHTQSLTHSGGVSRLTYTFLESAAARHSKYFPGVQDGIAEHSKRGHRSILWQEVLITDLYRQAPAGSLRTPGE